MSYTIFFALSMSILTISAVMLVVNQFTYKQRGELMPKAGDPHFWPKMKAFETITYNQHMIYLLTFRNPTPIYMKKYEEAIRENG